MSNEEVKKILNMIAEGKISVDEADELIKTVQESHKQEIEEKVKFKHSNRHQFPNIDIPEFEMPEIKIPEMPDFSNFGLQSGRRDRKARWFRIIVTNIETGRATTNIRLPMGFGNNGLRKFIRNKDIGEEVGLKGSDFDAFLEMDLESEGPTLIADIEDVDDNERVQIFIE